jgi:uncharacterized repeat protein (TIGR03803 family)
MFMKARIVSSLLIGAFGLISAERMRAQNLTTQYNFDGGNDGYQPLASLIASNDTLYGAAFSGGSSGNGALFAINTDGSGFTNIYNFTATLDPYYTNSDGSAPQASPILSGSIIYGTAYSGGSSGGGTVFAVNTNGTGFSPLYHFTNGNDGAEPLALVLLDNTLYGVANGGGSFGHGTIFAVTTNGAGFTNLLHFNGTNGAEPQGLILLSNTLYGTTYTGGSFGRGTLFKINIDGTSFTNLYSFSSSDGANPSRGLISLGNTLYGTTPYGGSSGNGTVFAINTDGTGFTNLYEFKSSSGSAPYCSLAVSGRTLYGTTLSGGSSGNGTVFAINTDGSGFMTLHNFTSAGSPYFTNYDGTAPGTGMLLLGNTLYGTTGEGGSFGLGTIFSLTLPLPLLAMVYSGTNVILTWPTNFGDFTLQSSTDIMGTFTNIPTATSPYTNSASNTQQFFRLSR